MNAIAIHWFRQDLRLSDNPSLIEATKHNNVLPIYILDDKNGDNFAMGAASKWWLESSLRSLNNSLGGKLSIYKGNPIDVLKDIIFALGEIELQKTSLIDRYREVTSKQEELGNELNKKYGDGKINLTSGEITPLEEQTDK